MIIRFALTAAALTLATTQAVSQVPEVIDCVGPFARNARHADIVAAFGAKNVVYRTVNGPEGTKHKATVIYPNEKARRIEVTWHDQRARSRPAEIMVFGDAKWRTPPGIGIGTTLLEVEKLNGRPFVLSGFSWDYAGSVTDWKGGTLSKRAGSCRLMVRFTPTGNYPGEVDGDTDFPSDLPAMRAAKPTIYQIQLSFPQ